MATRQKIEEAENVNAKLMISLDSRRPGLESEEFTAIVRDIAEDDDEDVSLETYSGQRIRRGELLLRQAVDVEIDGKTVHFNDAWDRMTEYYEQLTRQGFLNL